jgi:tryptophan halogenase
VNEASQARELGIRTVGVIGGGTSGYFAAIALKKRFPQLDVTVVESATIPVIGIDIVELFRDVRPTWKRRSPPS